MVVNRETIEQAVRTIEQHRGLLDPDVVELSLVALHRKLTGNPSMLPASQPVHFPDEQQPHTDNLTFMVAWLSDEASDRPATNKLARQLLVQTVRRWGGMVVQQPDEAVVALFGLTGMADGISHRAVWAALAMQNEMDVWQQQVAQTNGRFQIRVGLHRGEVDVTQPDGLRDLALNSSALHLTRRLAQLAPAGGCLISYEVQQSVSPYFDVEPLPLPNFAAEDGDGLNGLQTIVYRVLGEKTLDFWHDLRSNGMIPYLIGRDKEHELLQRALDQVVLRQQAHLVTVMGQVGLGKSHLLYHFEHWLKLSPVSALLLRARVQPGWLQWPLSPLGGVVANLLGLSLLDSRQVLQHKIRIGLRRYLPETAVSEAVGIVEHWLGIHAGQTGYSPAQWLMVQVRLLHSVVGRRVNGGSPVQVVVLLLEDLHEADELSINFVEALLRQCHDLPLLLVGSAQPSLRVKRPSWPTDVPVNRHTAIKLPPLSTIDARHLVSAFLPNYSPLPLKLYELLLAGARGVPLYIREAVRLLQLQGRLSPGEPLWTAPRLDESILSEILDLHWPGSPTEPLPDSLPGLFEQQIAAVSAPARSVLRRAAVMGNLFWDTAVSRLSQQPPFEGNGSNHESEQSDFTAVLQALITCGFVRRQPFPVYRRARGFAFSHPLLRQILVEQISPQQRHCYQQQVATWQQHLSNHEGIVDLPHLAAPPAPAMQSQPVLSSVVD